MSYEIEQVESPKGELIFKLHAKGEEFSSMELQFDQEKKLLIASKVWMSGEYELQGELLHSPRLEIHYTALRKSELNHYRLAQFITKDLALEKQYASYQFYNTLQ